MNGEWLAEYMGSETTNEQARSFARWLRLRDYDVPEQAPARGTASIIHIVRGQPISDDEWKTELQSWSNSI